MEIGMYLYPWDIGSGVDGFARDYERTGCTAMAPALSYHHGYILNARSGAAYMLDEAALSFRPDPAKFGRLRPAVHQAVADQGTVAKLREWSVKTGRHFCGWTVILHNSTLGSKHPDVVTENILGARYRHMLCPANPDVREYAETLLSVICDTLQPDSLMLESVTIPTAFHGEHHEIANVRITPAIRWLMSLCFCPSCLAAAARAGLDDPQKTRATGSVLLKRLLNRETSIPGNEWGQIGALLLEYPELYAYQRARQNTVAEFVDLLARVLRARKVTFKLIPSAIPHPITGSYLEGMSFAATAGMADALVPLVYGEGETYSLVKNNIRLMDGRTPVGMAMTLHPGRYPGKDDFVGAAAAAAAAAPACAYFYNYSIASEERLGWMTEACALLNAAR